MYFNESLKWQEDAPLEGILSIKTYSIINLLVCFFGYLTLLPAF